MRRGFFLVILFGFLGSAATAQFAVDENPARGTLTIRDEKVEVLTYRFGDQLKAGIDPKYTQSCYIHPLFSLDGRVLGIAVFASPDHPGFPTKWMIRNSYAGLINVSWPGLAAVSLKPGEPVTLRYWIYVHRGDAAAADVEAAQAAYTKGRIR